METNFGLFAPKVKVGSRTCSIVNDVVDNVDVHIVPSALAKQHMELIRPRIPTLFCDHSLTKPMKVLADSTDAT